ncbi:MAG TPA: hypothetical protein VMH33_14205 [Solirubrobacterales bacterium]|nr:hypothetical protein [Solirubrobacterales bacterium]
MAHAQDLGNGFHRQARLIGGTDGAVAFGPQLFGALGQFALLLCQVLGEGFKLGSGFWCLSLWPDDLKIVRPIPTNRLA